LPIDANPNAQGGLRIFPDKKEPNETVDRRKIRVKAQYGENTAGVRIYFRNFDLDDPSANTAPIDNETTPNAGDDNIGNVDGTANTRAGQLSIPQPNPNNCQTFATGVSCLTDAAGAATVDFTITQQPGDNFTVAASANETYLTELTLAADGVNLKDMNNMQTPVTTSNNNACMSSSVRACRADMLTVWRRLYIEVDSMGNVGADNNVKGTISAVGQAADNSCNPPPPSPQQQPPQNPPCYPTVTGFNVTTTSGQDLEVSRFKNGRIVIGKRTFNVFDNNTTSVFLKGVIPLAGKTKVGSSFTLYDDDDYNADDNLVDGDYNEPIMQLPESFKYLLAEDGNHSDGKPRNLYASAYIKLEYNWAQNVANYNQTNLAFDLNVSADETNNDELFFALTDNRNSKNDEKDDFWIAYFLLGYQGNNYEDADGDGANPGISKRLIGSVASCDCYQSTNCPEAMPGTPAPVPCSILPTGSFGSALYQEVQQDVHRSWLSVGRMFQNIETTAPHELGHQLGLSGDQSKSCQMLWK
jgi:hypothetical protein